MNVEHKKGNNHFKYKKYNLYIDAKKKKKKNITIWILMKDCYSQIFEIDI